MMIAWHGKGKQLAAVLFVALFSLAMQAAPDAKVEGAKLRVVIEWQVPVDLDLFLTGPDGETIYFGNRVARAGYKMQDESNCKSLASASAPYRETALIPVAEIGIYRVSIDYILNCGSDITEVGASVILYDDVTGLKLGSKDVIIKQQELKTVAWEFEVGEK